MKRWFQNLTTLLQKPKHTPVNSRGKLAKRIKKMQQFVVTFKIAKNITAPVGEKMVYVRIMKPDLTTENIYQPAAFSHKDEDASAGYYSLVLKEEGIKRCV